MVRDLSIAHGDSTLTFGVFPYSPVTLTLSKLFDALIGLGLGVFEVEALAWPMAWRAWQ